MKFCCQKSDDLVKVFTDNILSTNRGFNYYVDWTNIDGYKDFLVEIHAMDILIGCKESDFKDNFFTLVSKLPNVVLLFPFLFGLAKNEREQLYKGKNKLTIIQDELDCADHLVYSFSKGINLSDEKSIETYYDFFVQMGLKQLYQNIIEKSTFDYIVGVLVGMDSNGRKNRGGKAFELACQPLFEKICDKYQLKLLIQKQFKELRKYGFDISEDVANRKADFILLDDKKKAAINFEVNFYNDTGSKPEEIIDSYINRQNDLKSAGIDFALVTDGKCWITASNQLSKGFRHLNFLLNFYMLKHGMLEEIVNYVFKILNVVTWAKTNPPPNISCRYFTYSTEFIIWARKKEKKPHYFNYDLMKYLNGNKQMTDVWRLSAIAPWEKKCGKHPTQKPLALLSRIIMASTKPGEWVLDPFCGSSTTGIAANLLRRRFLGIDQEKDYLEISKHRREELDNSHIVYEYRSKIKDIKLMNSQCPYVVNDDIDVSYRDLPF